MSKKEDRLERSKLRAETHQRRRRIRFVILCAVWTILIVVPLLWYGAVEFGFAHPIATPEFKGALNMAWVVLNLIGLGLLFEFWFPYLLRVSRMFDDKKKGDQHKIQLVGEQS